MRKIPSSTLLALVGGLVVLAGVAFASTGALAPSPAAGPNAGAPSAAGSQRTLAQSPGVRLELVASGLQVPWALAFAPDGRLFFTERPGRVRVMVDGQVLPEPVATLPVTSVSESGLMGLALDPEFAANGYLYVAYTYRGSGGGLINRVSRLTVEGNTAGQEMILLDDIPGAPNHDGGRLRFGPAAKLFVTTGDAQNQALPQSLNSVAGKILRLNTDGSIPDDNPFPGSPIYSYGHRNPQGLAFQMGTGVLLSTEHGASGNDEVNVIEAGQNYGWPVVQAQPGDPRFVDPISVYSPAIAPASATFYDGDLIPEWKGNLFFGTLRGQHLHRVVLGEDPREVVFEERLYEGEFGRIRDVIQGPDGFIYFTTSNRDGRGSPAQDDDRIFRIVPE